MLLFSGNEKFHKKCEEDIYGIAATLGKNCVLIYSYFRSHDHHIAYLRRSRLNYNFSESVICATVRVVFKIWVNFSGKKNNS